MGYVWGGGRFSKIKYDGQVGRQFLHTCCTVNNRSRLELFQADYKCNLMEECLHTVAQLHYESVLVNS